MGKHHCLVLRDHSYSWFQICAQQFSGALQVPAFFFFFLCPVPFYERFYHIYTVTVMEANIKDGEG